jgi:hypothetical protein
MGRKPKSKGLGDTIAKITEVTGISTLVDKVTDVLGIEDCGCSRRQETLNQWFPYENTTPQQPPLIEQNIVDFAQGMYIINNNLVFTRQGITYDYKVGDRIYITDHNPLFNDFKEYFKLGVISKYESL